MRLVLEFSREDLGKLPIAVIVENFGKVVGREAGGKQRKAYFEEFDENERDKIKYYYSNYFYRWVVATGLPARYAFRSLETVNLIKRAGNFFGGL